MRALFRRFWVGPLILTWIGLWAAINSGPWHLREPPETMVEWINALRALWPYLVPAAWLLTAAFLRRSPRFPPLAEACWIGYALLALISALRFPEAFDLAYWALAYLAVFAVIDWIIGRDARPERLMALNRFNWLLATSMLTLMLLFARDVLLVQGPTGLTAYGVVHRVDAGGFGPISRSSGLARLAIVPAVVGVVMVRASVGTLARLAWGSVALAALSAIWLFQSRQGIFGALAAVALVVMLLDVKYRMLSMGLLLVACLLLLVGMLPDEWISYIVAHATRSEGISAFDSMSGRDLIWRLCWKAIEDAPLLGYGPEADRRIVGINAQNGALYAGLSAGFVGAALYLGGLIWGWVLLARAFRRRYARTRSERLFLVQVAGIMAYLTIRNIPENTAALFSVDLLLHAPLLVYLGALDRVRRNERQPHRRALEIAPTSARGLGVATPTLREIDHQLAQRGYKAGGAE